MLFIDEAYSLSTYQKNDFGREAVEMLLKEMEDPFEFHDHPQLFDRWPAARESCDQYYGSLDSHRLIPIQFFRSSTFRGRSMRLKLAVLLLCASIAIFPKASIAGPNWGEGLKALSEGVGKMAEEERKLEQQKELLEYQHKLELERMRKQQVLEEQRRQEQIQRQKAAEEQARRRAEEEKRNAISTGTGFFVNPDGYLITNHHVVSDKTDVAVRDLKGRFYRAQVVARDQRRDLALIKVTGHFPSLRITHSDSVTKGQRVYAVGYPQISIQGNESKVTDGVISSFSGIRNDDDWFQISVPIQGGNSGGPLVTESGQVVGVVVASVNVSKFHSIAGTIPQNVNYAIKSKLLLGFLDDHRIKNVSTFSEKARIGDVDNASVLVIAKNGPIDVSYSINLEQQGIDQRDRARQVADDAKRRTQEQIAERKKQADEAAAERNRRKELAAEESRRKRDAAIAEKQQREEDRQLSRRNSEVAKAMPGWESVRDSELFSAWLRGKSDSAGAKIRSAKSADVIEILRLYELEKVAFEEAHIAKNAAKEIPSPPVRAATTPIPNTATIGRVTRSLSDFGYLVADVSLLSVASGRRCFLRWRDRNIPCSIEKVSGGMASLTLSDKTPIVASMVGAIVFSAD